MPFSNKIDCHAREHALMALREILTQPDSMEYRLQIEAARITLEDGTTNGLVNTGDEDKDYHEIAKVKLMQIISNTSRDEPAIAVEAARVLLAVPYFSPNP